MRTALLLLAAVLLIGCSANSTEEYPASPLALPSDARTHLIVNFKAGNEVFRNAYWDQFKSAWRAAIQREASIYGYSVTEQVGPITTASDPGLLLIIKVNDFRYVTESEGTDDAWIDARVIYLDAQTAKEYGEREYDTSSSAWESVDSAMTDAQVQAITKDMLDEIRTAKALPATSQAVTPSPSAVPGLTREQQLEQLKAETGLSYEEYQRRHHAIVGGSRATGDGGGYAPKQ
ncbi:hypothetical protein [Pseudomonas sp. LFM046]|uniref:hypothetical protein n=1 Tax=Pseudomonas sp. LFM046 TaxID=1608357 RepID=UPI000696FB08|nr:hypothetical protein [Pseudomonas sp. LFM046]